MGRNQGLGNRPGRSRWPEADTIRRATNTHAPMHKPEHPVDGFYPRAAFGLPLVFHFKDKNEGDPRGQDSDSLVLNPEGHDRMASPLILRPYFDGRQYRPDGAASARLGEAHQHPSAFQLAPRETRVAGRLSRARVAGGKHQANGRQRL